MLINQEGFYHGVIVSGSLGQSTNGFPQEILALRADEVYDSESDSYLPWDAENAEITAYLILIDGKDRETKTMQQLKKVIGWDGGSFVDLNEMDLTDMPIAFRVQENVYNGNTTLQVSWIDTLDASPTRTVPKLAKEDVAALQARYASVLAGTKSAAKPASAKKTTEPAAQAPATAGTTTPPKAKTIKSKTPPKAPKTVVGKCTADDAYNACYSLKRDDVTEDALNDMWLEAVAAVNKDESKITKEQWFEIKEGLLKQVSKV